MTVLYQCIQMMYRLCNYWIAFPHQRHACKADTSQHTTFFTKQFRWYDMLFQCSVRYKYAQQYLRILSLTFPALYHAEPSSSLHDGTRYAVIRLLCLAQLWSAFPVHYRNMCDVTMEQHCRCIKPLCVAVAMYDGSWLFQCSGKTNIPLPLLVLRPPEIYKVRGLPIAMITNRFH